MRRRIVILVVLFFIFLFAGLIACTKKKAPDTPFTRVQGKWRKVKYATDDNNNGTIEASEIHAVPAKLDNEILFTNEETGVETTVDSGVTSIPLTFNWKIVGGDSVWVAYKANDTIVYFLTSVSSHDLTLTATTQFGLASYYYVK